MQPSDLRGVSRLVIDAIVGVIDVVEAMHVSIAHPPGRPRSDTPGPARGITGISYRSVKAITGGVGFAIDTALGRIVPLLARAESSDRRENLRSALNGVLGDYLDTTQNPLAIPMRLQREGLRLDLDRTFLARAVERPSPHILVMVHGLCRNDRQWSQGEWQPAEELAHDLAHTALYLHYNSGRNISINGREMAGLLETLVEEWPVPVESLTLVTHSMGGLVARSACHYAAADSLRWKSLLRQKVFIATPHHGAPLERIGNWTDRLLSATPYTAPLARLGQIRSAGITDLRHGNLLDQDWEDRDRFDAGGDRRQPVPLPVDTPCYAIAATLGESAGRMRKQVVGDGWVPLNSALGLHREPRHNLEIPPSRQWIAGDTSHLGLLRSDAMWKRIRGWMRSSEAT